MLNSQHLAIDICGDLAHWRSSIASVLGSSCMPKRPYEWRVDSHGCYKFDNAALGFGPRDQTAHLPVFLHLRTTNLPGPSSITRSEQAQQRRSSADITNTSVCGDDVLDCDVAHLLFCGLILSPCEQPTASRLWTAPVYCGF